MAVTYTYIPTDRYKSVLCLSVDDCEAGVGAQTFWHYDAIGCLVVLEQSGHDAWQSQGGAVERVAQAYLLVVATVAAVQTVGLICLEVGYRRYFKPAFLCGRPYLEVESYGGCEAHVSATQTEYMPWEAEFVEQ